MGPEERKAYQAAWQKEYRKRKKEEKHDGACAGAQAAIQEGLDAAAAKSKREETEADAHVLSLLDPEPPSCPAKPHEECPDGNCPFALDPDLFSTAKECPRAIEWEAWETRQIVRGNSPI